MARKKSSNKKKAGPPPAKAKSNTGFPIVGVGASAGGLEAFQTLLSALPGNTGMAFVLVPHLAPQHDSIMTELLSKHSSLPVMEVRDGTQVQPNHVYVIPPSADIGIDKGVLYLTAISSSASRRMPIDHFLRSLANDQQNRAIGVILSGTASDGTLGLQAIKSQGGITFAQDDQSAKYSAMPRSAIATGSVDFILPPDLIARELVRISRHIQVLKKVDGGDSESPGLDDTLSKIFLLLKNLCHVDFTLYKLGTIQRRIGRRMFIRKVETMEEYLRLLKSNAEEIQALFNDLLINVTGFFRDPDAFEVLKSSAFPSIMTDKSPSSAIRVWVPGCSTGEEAYSVAISLLEFLGSGHTGTVIQVFATDVSEEIIQQARTGVYPENIGLELSPDRLRRYFQKVDGGYQINKAIRDMCVFAKQDITRDPPFSRLDMISCRNVMIYMNQVLQKRIIPLFHYALNPGGILFLGSSETIGTHADLFSSLDRKHKIYAKKAVASARFDFVPHFNLSEEESKDVERSSTARQPDFQRLAGEALLNRFAPASVMVNQNLDIVQFIGNTGPFLSPTPGDASLNLLRLVKKGLHLELRVAFQKMKGDASVRREGLLVEHNGGFRAVNFEILPIRASTSAEQYYVVVFEESVKSNQAEPREKPNVSKAKAKGKPSSPQEAEVIRLKEELDETREYLQSIIEEQRTTNEELRSANEEIQSSNEELQSINEELETAKEELQSTNEELTTVNEELQNRNDDLSQMTNDLSNLLSSVNIPIVMLGNDLKIRRFTPLAERIMNLIPTDIGRPITDIKPNLKIQDLRGMVLDVIETLKVEDTDVETGDGRRYSMRIRPYRTADNKIDGVVIVLLDRPAPSLKKQNEGAQS